MSTVPSHPLVDDYLRRLHAAGWVLPPDRREELVAEIREHAEDALAASGARDEVTVRNVLERLGPPEETVAAALEATPPPGSGPPPAASGARGGAAPGVAAPTRRLGGIEIAALVALAVGGIVVPVVGVLVGLVLAWASSLWTRADKVVATVLPVGVAFLAALPLGWLARVGGGLPFAHPRFFDLMPFSGPGGVFGGTFGVGVLGLGLGAMAVGGMLAAGFLAVRASRRTGTGG